MTHIFVIILITSKRGQAFKYFCLLQVAKISDLQAVWYLLIVNVYNYTCIFEIYIYFAVFVAQLDFPFVESHRVKEASFHIRMPVSWSYRDKDYSEINDQAKQPKSRLQVF